MNMPGFTAEHSIYPITGQYRSHLDSGRSPPTDIVAPAYFPGPVGQEKCKNCSDTAVKNFGGCLAVAEGLCALGCIAAGPFYPICFAACSGAALGTCNVDLLREMAVCVFDDCCPKMCEFPNPFEPGQGCCDAGENCVDKNDPNSRHGCCPADQNVCAGKCCPKLHSCCGGECCPPNFHCIDGTCVQYPSFGTGTPPAPPPHISYCIEGYTPCNGSCCAPGQECCSDGVCRSTCLH